MEKTRLIEIKSPDGKSLVTFLITEKEIVGKNDNSKQESKGGQNNGRNQNSDTLMTEPQKRYLFRILADQGLEGEAIYEKIKVLFHVETLKEVTKQEASKMIERLLEEAKGGDAGGVSF